MATARTASEIEALLVGLFNDVVGPAELDEALDGALVQTFADAGLLTRDVGIVIRLRSGAAFQMSVVKSEWGDGAVCCECGDEFGDLLDYVEHLITDHRWDDHDALAEAGAL